jgi:deoxyribonuclease-4
MFSLPISKKRKLRAQSKTKRTEQKRSNEKRRNLQTTRKIGAHVSASGGVEKAVERAANIGANCVQVFSGSPRVWQRPDLETVELSVEPIFTHALYLLNLASENPDLVRKSIEAISFDLRFDSKLNGAGVVVHLGSHQGRGWDAVKDQVAQTITEILSKAPSNAHFLMENAAGQNGKIGGNLEELRWLFDQVQSDQLGWCMDTCHAFASGYHLGDGKAANVDGQKNTREGSIIEEIERLQLGEKLTCVHVNDSRDPFGSGRDRHENLGDGLIGQENLRAFVNHPLIVSKPLILEVPGIKDEGPDAENIIRLKKLVEG